MWLSLLFLAPAYAQQTCTFTLSPTARSVPASPDTIGTLTVNASASSCARTAVTDSPDWLTISFGTTGTGNGSIGYRVDENRTAAARNGSITVGNARFTVSQAGANCSFSLSVTSAQVPRTAGRGTIRVTTNCAWTAASNADWLRITSGASGSGDGTIEYTYDDNPAVSQRTATITAAGRAFTLTQEGVPCTVSVNPTAADFPGDGGTGTIAVTSACNWQVSTSQNWVTITSSTSGSGNAAVSYRVAANTTTAARQAAIAIANQTIVIRQAATVLPVVTSITNAASFARDSAAPGTVLAIFGQRLGPLQIATAQLTDDGLALTTTLGGTRVWFDDTPAPLIYSLDSVVSAVVPYNTEGKRSTKVVVEYQGRRSAESTLNLTAAAPGIFTANASGTGQAAALNQDLSYNGPANPAQRGQTIVLYLTGEGVTDPPGVDGRLNGLTPSQPVAPVIVSIGGAVAQVTYKGGVYGVTPGLMQINAVIPLAAPTGGAVPLTVNIGGVLAQRDVTVAVQ
ncbi:MAG: BACON domain-containing carbohydrate-binding protein [Bryobacteraceae bacterium]